MAFFAQRGAVQPAVGESNGTLKGNGDRTARLAHKDGTFHPVDLCSRPMVQTLPPTDSLGPLQMLFRFAINDNYASCAQRIVFDQMEKCCVFVCAIAIWLVPVCCCSTFVIKRVTLVCVYCAGVCTERFTHG